MCGSVRCVHAEGLGCVCVGVARRQAPVVLCAGAIPISSLFHPSFILTHTADAEQQRVGPVYGGWIQRCGHRVPCCRRARPPQRQPRASMDGDGWCAMSWDSIVYGIDDPISDRVNHDWCCMDAQRVHRALQSASQVYASQDGALALVQILNTAAVVGQITTILAPSGQLFLACACIARPCPSTSIVPSAAAEAGPGQDVPAPATHDQLPIDRSASVIVDSHVWLWSDS